MKFRNLSPTPTPDFSLKFQTQIDILMKNVLYMTHEIDQIKRLVTKINNSINLQKQVDEYFTKDETDEMHETSPQTEQSEQ